MSCSIEPSYVLRGVFELCSSPCSAIFAGAVLCTAPSQTGASMHRHVGWPASLNDTAPSLAICPLGNPKLKKFEQEMGKSYSKGETRAEGLHSDVKLHGATFELQLQQDLATVFCHDGRESDTVSPYRLDSSGCPAPSGCRCPSCWGLRFPPREASVVHWVGDGEQ